MLDSYLPTFVLTVLYLLSIWLGNRFMKSRPALSLRGLLTFYNLGITLLSAYMLAEVSVRAARAGARSRGGWRSNSSAVRTVLDMARSCSSV